MLYYSINTNPLGGLLTIAGQDGKPVEVDASMLQAQFQNQASPGTPIIEFSLIYQSVENYKLLRLVSLV